MRVIWNFSIPVYVVVRAEGYNSAIRQAVVNRAFPYTSAIEIVRVHEVHRADKEEIEMEVTQIPIIVTFYKLNKELF
jgi:hypothetical protein